jgi:oligopeptide/dipeptide ABC transporter ATP-binding protein
VTGEATLHGSKDDWLLRLRQLTVGFDDDVEQAAVRQLDLEIRRGEVFALVGESGCGKSLTALSILGLLPPGARRLGGSIEHAELGSLLDLSPSRQRAFRGKHIAMVFQEPASALNPVLSIGFQIMEVLRLHRGLSRSAARREAVAWLRRVAMPDPEERLGAYPHQLSGGQQQRAMLAMALASGPHLLLADEPTTALDVTVQAQVLDLLLDLRQELGLTILLITHDLGVVAQCSDRVGVMYAGQLVEEATVQTLFASPAHPYTRGLLASLPRLGGDGLPEGIAGQVPDPGQRPAGCVFAPRCGAVMDRCRVADPPWVTLSGAAGEAAAGSGELHRSRCFLHTGGEGAGP